MLAIKWKVIGWTNTFTIILSPTFLTKSCNDDDGHVKMDSNYHSIVSSHLVKGCPLFLCGLTRLECAHLIGFHSVASFVHSGHSGTELTNFSLRRWTIALHSITG